MGIDDLVSAAFPLLLIFCAVGAGFVFCQIALRLGVRMNRQRAVVEQKAVTLLKGWLSPAQLAQYEVSGHFEVTGSHSGTRYRIRHGRQMNVDELDERGVRVAVLCVLPERPLPAGDVMLAQKIALETDEPATLQVAVRSPYETCVPHVLP